MAHGDAREGKCRGNWRMEWVASTLHTTLEHVVSSITTADAHTSAASSRLNWRHRRFKWTRLFHRKTKSGFCACPITFQLASTTRRSSKLFNMFLLQKTYFNVTLRGVLVLFYCFWLDQGILTFIFISFVVITCEIKCRIAVAKAAFNKKRTLFTSTLDL